MATDENKVFGRYYLDAETGKLIARPVTQTERDARQIKGWEDRATGWAEKGGVQPFDRTLVQDFLDRKITSLVSENGRILDLAVGAKSHLPDHLIPRSFSVDLAQQMLELNPNAIKPVVANARALPFSARSFELVLSTFMMRYLTLSDQLMALSEMLRVTQPGGVVCVIDFDTIGYSLESASFDPGELRTFLRNSELFSQGSFTQEICQLKQKPHDTPLQGSPGNLYAMILQVGAL